MLLRVLCVVALAGQRGPTIASCQVCCAPSKLVLFNYFDVSGLLGCSSCFFSCLVVLFCFDVHLAAFVLLEI